MPLLDQLLHKVEVRLENIDLIAFTNGPGLLGPLLTGAAFAKSLAWSMNIKSIEISCRRKKRARKLISKPFFGKCRFHAIFAIFPH